MYIQLQQEHVQPRDDLLIPTTNFTHCDSRTFSSKLFHYISPFLMDFLIVKGLFGTFGSLSFVFHLPCANPHPYYVTLSCTVPLSYKKRYALHVLNRQPHTKYLFCLFQTCLWTSSLFHPPLRLLLPLMEATMWGLGCRTLSCRKVGAKCST